MSTADSPPPPSLDDVLALLPSGVRLTARKIAKLLDATRTAVNRVLYSAPKGLVSKDPATQEWGLCIPPAPPTKYRLLTESERLSLLETPSAQKDLQGFLKAQRVNLLPWPYKPAQPPPSPSPSPSHLVLPNNSTGWSYHRLFAQHVTGAHKITIRDPYVRKTFQLRNLLEFLKMVHGLIPEGDTVTVLLITKDDAETRDNQAQQLNRISDGFTDDRLSFSWELNTAPELHARSIITDTGVKISIDRGLDIFQYFETGPLSVEQSVQELRRVKQTEITYLTLQSGEEGVI